jgi:hypothetical protein
LKKKMKKNKDVGDEELGRCWARQGGVGVLFKSKNLNELWAVQEKMGQAVKGSH